MSHVNPSGQIAHALLTLEEAAPIARTSIPTLRGWLASGKLASVKPGRRRLVRRAALYALLGLTADDVGA